MPFRTLSKLLFAVLPLLALLACPGDDPTVTNIPPSANAGSDLSTNVGVLVQLNGTGTDADGNNLTYTWTFASRPAGSSAILNGASSASASFTPDVGGQYVLTFTVSDGQASHSDGCTITVNSPPTANAGADQNVNVGDMVQLNGLGSTDPEGSSLTYAWSFQTRPPGSTATLQNSASGTPTFTPDVGGDYVVRLVVSDGSLSSDPDDCVISANTPPVANAGPDQQVGVGEVVQLDGTGSSDPDGIGGTAGVTAASSATLTYLWSFVSRPNGSQATLSIHTSPTPTFTADVAGTFVVGLVVSDGQATSQPDQMTVTAATAQTQLFLRSEGGDSFLSTQQATAGSTRITLYNYGSGQSTDFEAILGNGLNGANYGAIMWFGAGTGSGQTGTWTVSILIEHTGVQTTLAARTFTVPYNTLFIRYTADFTGMSGGVAGDKIIVRLTLNGVSRGAVLFGSGDLDSSVSVPGSVTVTPAPTSERARVEENSGVRVEVTAGHSRRYPGG